MKTISTVYLRHPARHDMAGRFLGYPLSLTDETVSSGLRARLAKYAEKRIRDIGLFPVNVNTCEVSTTGADEKPSERVYSVGFHTKEGGTIGLQGVMTKQGWPFLDHGIYTDE